MLIVTPQAFDRYHAAVARERALQVRPWGEFRFEYSMRGFFGRTHWCQGGMHWACNGRRGRGRGETLTHTPCPCPCHELDGRRSYLREERAAN